MNYHPVILFHAKGIPFSQAKRYRRITSDDDCFKQDLSRLETYFISSNYPVDILTEALQRASNLTIEEALQSCPSERNNQDVITFVCTYNPSFPNIGKIINQYWDLFKISTSESIRRLYESKPIVAYKRPTNVHGMFVHPNLSKLKSDFNVTKCDRRRCTTILILLDILFKIFPLCLSTKFQTTGKGFLKATTWMHVLGTISTRGMNSKVLS